METATIRNDLKSIEDGMERWKAIKQDGEYDKKGFGFNKDDRFSSCLLTLSLDNWSGVYGCSSCYKFVRNVGPAFKEAMVLWMNANIDTILENVCILMRDELRKRKEKELSRIVEMKAEVDAW